MLSVIQRYGRRLGHFIRGRVNSPEDAEDILQDVWYQLSRLGDLETVENINAWLFRVARNRITDRYRERDMDSLDEPLFDSKDEDGFPVSEILLASDEDPDAAFFKELFWETLLQALDELPENQRRVFVENELEDLTLQEIANASGENLKTIISRKRYAVQHLRRRLQNLYDELNNLES
jgi:RNA polymerase sigma factor (sigma-70 family)